MAIPYFCKGCGEIIGMESESITVLRTVGDSRGSTFLDVPCHGAANHLPPKRHEQRRLFGLIRAISEEYPETFTHSSWEEYSGPPSRFFLWIAIVFGTKRYPNGSYAGVLVNGEWAWWDLKTGFYGDGLIELSKMRTEANRA